jgi:hypothetical protein
VLATGLGAGGRAYHRAADSPAMSPATATIAIQRMRPLGS